MSPVDLQGRHLELSEPLAPWACPACGQTNAGELAAGCAGCGSGTNQARKAPAEAVPPTRRRMDPRDPPVQQAVSAPVAAAEAWLARLPDGDRLPGAVRQWVIDAFCAGWAAAQAQTGGGAGMVQQTPTIDTRPVFSPEGAVARTLVAALEMFVDQVLRGADEEIASGEWCSVAEAQRVIAQLHGVPETRLPTMQEDQIHGE